MRAIWIILIALVFTSCDSCSDCNQAPESARPKHWVAYPILLTVDRGLAACQRLGVMRARDFWHRTIGSDVFAVVELQSDSLQLVDPRMHSASVVDGRGRQARPGALGSTFIWSNDGWMHSAEVRLPSCIAGYDRIYAHEFGHVLGLLDNPQPGTLMHVVHDPKAWRVQAAELVHVRSPLM